MRYRFITHTLASLAITVACVSVAIAGNTRYFYDDLGRLTRVERDADCTVITYTYDAVGNRLTRSVIVDQDCDTVRDALDCAPADALVFAPPQEIANLRILATQSTIDWDSDAANSGAGTTYDLLRGVIGEYPVGSGAAETCLDPGSTDTTAEDPDSPGVGSGFYYLVRGTNVCGVGTYGTDSGGTDRVASACP